VAAPIVIVLVVVLECLQDRSEDETTSTIAEDGHPHRLNETDVSE
jgi:hypothetical protein